MLTVILALLYLAVAAIFGITCFVVNDEFNFLGRSFLGLFLGLIWPVTLVGGLIIRAVSDDEQTKPLIIDNGYLVALINKSSEEFRKKLDWVLNPVILVAEKDGEKMLCCNQARVFSDSKLTVDESLNLTEVLKNNVVPRLRNGEEQIVIDGAVYRQAKSEDVAPVFEKALLERLSKAHEDIEPNSMMSLGFWMSKVFTNSEIQLLRVLEDEWGEDRSHRWLVEVLQRSGKFRDAGDGAVEPA